MQQIEDPAIDVRGLCTRFGAQQVHEGLDLQIGRGEIFAIIGGSGSGKSTLLREMILLHRPDAGSIHVFGQDLQALDRRQANALRLRWGVMFQQGGLFGSLTVAENVAWPLQEHTDLDATVIEGIAALKIAMAGLEPQAATRYPSELSGGMVKRAALARALALDPQLLFLDEPTAGLDPHSAAGVDALVRELRDLFGLTIVIITHDLDLLWQVADRVAVLGAGRVQAVGSMAELAELDNETVKPFFTGARGRSARVGAAAVDGNTRAAGQEAVWKAR
jgi:phospholipid/cholesterol/gamma-HCH transport system ATP-binding protein